MSNVQSNQVLDELKKLGFESCSESASDTDFGNRLIKMAKGPLRARIVVDRGKVTVDLSPAHSPQEWFDLALVLKLEKQFNGSDEAASLEAQIHQLRTNLQWIQQSFSEARWKDTHFALKELELARMKQLFGHAVIDPSR